MRPSPTLRREAEGLFQLSARATPLFVGLAVIAAFLGHSGALDAVVMLLTGALCGALLLLSWRIYHPIFAWVLWVAPGATVFTIAATYAVLPRVDTGEISILHAICLIIDCGGLGFFGLLFLAPWLCQALAWFTLTLALFLKLDPHQCAPSM